VPIVKVSLAPSAAGAAPLEVDVKVMTAGDAAGDAGWKKDALLRAYLAQDRCVLSLLVVPQ
jgi:hypothetical protein